MGSQATGVTFRNGHPVVPSDVRREYAHVEGTFSLVERDPLSADLDVCHLVGSYAECVTYRDALQAHHSGMGDLRDFDIVPHFDFEDVTSGPTVSAETNNNNMHGKGGR